MTLRGTGSNYCDLHIGQDKMAETTQMLSFHELFFNVDNGYLEGLVRGFRSGVLSQSDYLNLSQCETLEGKPSVRTELATGIERSLCCRNNLGSLYLSGIEIESNKIAQ